MIRGNSSRWPGSGLSSAHGPRAGVHFDDWIYIPASHGFKDLKRGGGRLRGALTEITFLIPESVKVG